MYSQIVDIFLHEKKIRIIWLQPKAQFLLLDIQQNDSGIYIMEYLPLK